MKRYHYQVGFPTDLKLPTEVIHIKRVSKHAEWAARTDRYAPEGIKLPKVIDPRALLIECDVVDGVVIKAVYRVPYDQFERDLVLVVNLETKTLVTCWINLRDDKHKTLRVEAYDRP